MKLDLSGFLEGREDMIKLEGQIDSIDLNLKDRDAELVGPVDYSLLVFEADREKAIDMEIDFTYSESCSRCLERSKNNMKSRLSGKLVKGKRDLEKELKEENNEDQEGYEEVLYYENNTLNLDEYIREQILLTLPMKTVCAEDCKGLCSKCGIDLNKGECDCVHDDIDPRLEKLKDFFPKD